MQRADEMNLLGLFTLFVSESRELLVAADCEAGEPIEQERGAKPMSFASNGTWKIALSTIVSSAAITVIGIAYFAGIS